MPRSCWRVVLTALGIITLSILSYHVGRNEQARRDQQPSEISQVVPRTLQEASQAYHKGCDHPQDWDRASTCAAISAANSATVANIRVQQDAGWGHVGIIAGLLTLVAAIVAASYAGTAAYHTKRGADAAYKANALAKSAAELEYRPIIVFSDYLLEEGAGVNSLYAKPIWENIGTWPAKITENSTRKLYCSGQPQQIDIDRCRQEPPRRAPDYGILPNSMKMLGAANIVTGQDVGRHQSGPGDFYSKNTVMMIYTIKYKSIIGHQTEWTTEHIVGYSPVWGPDGRMRHDDIHTLYLRGLTTYEMT